MTDLHRAAPLAAAVFMAALLLTLPRPTLAWGTEGHEIVGLIARHYLDPAARRRLEAILATDRSGLVRGTGIAAESTWADRYRDSDRTRGGARYRHTRQWHYADIEPNDSDPRRACFGEQALPPGEPASQGPADDCVIDKVLQFNEELARPETTPRERLRALQFLLHFVGDLHQPLHSSDDHDRGGNDERILISGMRGASLHHAWDTTFVADLGRSPARVAARLIRGLTPAERRAFSGGTPLDWAMQSHRIALRIAYGRLPRPGADGIYRLDDAYVAAAKAAVRVQLQRAGLRLARLLNADFAGAARR